MNRSARRMGILLGILLGTTVWSSPALCAGIRWYGHEQGLVQAKKQQKKVFLYFWADWCQYCGKMEEETLSKKAVIDLLNKNFIPIKINSEVDRSIAERYFVRGLPTTWFLSAQGEKISNLPGYVEPDLFVPILEFIHSESYQKMSFKEFLNKK